MNDMLLGMIAMGLFVGGLFFLRFWKNTRERFFLFFAVSFWVEAVNRALLAVVGADAPEDVPIFYVIRLIAFGLILFAIIDKNRPKKPSV